MIQHYALIILIVIIFYIRTLRYSIIVDDIKHYSRHKDGKYTFYKEFYKDKTKSLFWKVKYIFGYLVTQLYGSCTFGLNTIIDHLFTTILHALTCCLIYSAFGSNIISFWTAILYAVNPINNQTSIWLNGRRYQMVIILCLLAILLQPLGILFYILSCAFQVTGFFLPVLFYQSSPLFLLLIPILAFLGRKRMIDTYKQRMDRIYNDDQKTWSINRLKVVIKSYGFYFFKMINPGLTMFIYPTLVKWGVTKEGNKDAYSINFDFIKGITALTITGWLITIPEIRLYAILIFLATIQWSAIICAFQQLADRYISFANVFMMYILTYLIFTYMPSYALIIAVGLFSYYATQLQVTMKLYETIDRFFEYQMFWCPDLTRNRIIYADSYLKIKDLTRAWLIVERGLFYDPNDFELLFRAAQCSASICNFDKAEHFIERAEQNFYIGQQGLQIDRLNKLKNEIIEIKKQLKNEK